MKTFVLSLALFLSFGILTENQVMAQTSSSGQQINAITTAVPFFSTSIPAPTNPDRTRAFIDVPGVGRAGVDWFLDYTAFNATGAGVDWEFDWGTVNMATIQTSAYRPSIRKMRVDPRSGLIAQFQVLGHPKGPGMVNFKPIKNTVDPRTGRKR